MASSSQDQGTTDPLLQELRTIRMGLSSVLKLMNDQQKQQQRLVELLDKVSTTLDGFTSSGSSFRSYQIDPMVIVYASILGPILGDRLDAAVTKGTDYEDLMIRGAIPYARRLLRELDAYLQQGDGRSYLEHMAGDIKPPTEPPTPTTT